MDPVLTEGTLNLATPAWHVLWCGSQQPANVQLKPAYCEIRLSGYSYRNNYGDVDRCSGWGFIFVTLLNAAH